MAREQTLLQRIAAGASGERRAVGPTVAEDVDALMEAVRSHLARLLNSRHGMAEALPDYGLPAMSDLSMGTGDPVQIVQDALQRTIERYEPRLRRVSVTRVVEENGPARAISFRVDAVLAGRTSEYRVWYETSMTGNGQFDVGG